MLGILLAVAAMVALSGTGKLLWDGIGTWASTATVLPVIDRLLVALILVGILHTVRISIRSHSLVTEPFLVVGLIASIRRMLVVEAGCKVAIGTRLKGTGMHWTVRGANEIIALRCSILSGRFEDFWERRAALPIAA